MADQDSPTDNVSINSEHDFATRCATAHTLPFLLIRLEDAPDPSGGTSQYPVRGL